VSAELLRSEPGNNKLSCGIGSVEELEGLLHGTLSPQRAAEVLAHSDCCPVCARELGWLRAEKELFAQRARGVPPSQVWAQVEARLSQRLALQLAHEPPRSRWRDRLRAPAAQWAAVGAAAALLGIVAASPLSPLKHGLFQRPAAKADDGARAAAMVPRFDGFDRDDAALGGGGEDDSRSLAATTKVSGAVTVSLDAAAADIDVQVGVAGEVQIHVDDTDAHAVKVIERNKGHLQFEFDNSSHLDSGEVRLLVPVGTSVELRTASGDVSIGAVQGDVAVQSISGDVRVRAGRKVSVTSVSGDVAIERASGPLTVQTTSGDLRLSGDVTSPVRFTSTSGGLDLSGSCAAGCQIHAHTTSGDVSLSGRSSLVAKLRTRTGEISGADHLAVEMRRNAGDKSEWTVHLGRSEGLVEVETFSGDLNLRPQ
jgi:DUF4097 and DUF4098 domain-containing protein YvlB